MRTANMKLSELKLDAVKGSRSSLNSEATEAYKELYASKDCKLPPIVVFKTSAGELVLAAGYHRVTAALAAGLATLPAQVLEGTALDAILYAVRDNAEHGVRRTHDDKQACVLSLLNTQEWRAKSNRAIAAACNVSHSFVAKVKEHLHPKPTQVQTNHTPPATNHPSPTTQIESDIGEPDPPDTNHTPATRHPSPTTQSATQIDWKTFADDIGRVRRHIVHIGSVLGIRSSNEIIEQLRILSELKARAISTYETTTGSEVEDV